MKHDFLSPDFVQTNFIIQREIFKIAKSIFKDSKPELCFNSKLRSFIQSPLTHSLKDQWTSCRILQRLCLIVANTSSTAFISNYVGETILCMEIEIAVPGSFSSTITTVSEQFSEVSVSTLPYKLSDVKNRVHWESLDVCLLSAYTDN